MVAVTRFVLGGKDGETELAPEAFVLHLVPQETLTTRKCKECEDATPKSVVQLFSMPKSGEVAPRASKRIYTCTKCGDITVAS